MSGTPLGPIICSQKEAPGILEAGGSCSLLRLLPTPGRVDLGEASGRGALMGPKQQERPKRLWILASIRRKKKNP